MTKKKRLCEPPSKNHLKLNFSLLQVKLDIHLESIVELSKKFLSQLLEFVRIVFP